MTDSGQQAAPRRHRAWLNVALVVAVGGVAVSLVLLGAAVTYRRYAEEHYRDRCPGNLRQIGQAVMIYADAHGGAFPATMEPLLDDLTPRGLVCPSTREDPPGETSEQVRAALRAGKQLSYVYVGDGLTTSHGNDYVVAYDRAENHEHDGANVLFADGHVDWLPMGSFRYILDEVAAGRLPVRVRRGGQTTATATTTNPGP